MLLPSRSPPSTARVVMSVIDCGGGGSFSSEPNGSMARVSSSKMGIGNLAVCWKLPKSPAEIGARYGITASEEVSGLIRNWHLCIH